MRYDSARLTGFSTNYDSKRRGSIDSTFFVLVLLLLLLENIRLAVLQLLSHLLRSRHIDLRRSRQALQHLHILYITPRES